jgi:hypothetical protein
MCSSKAFSGGPAPGKTRQNLKSLASIGVTNGRHEEAEAEGQHDDVQHEMLLVARVARFRALFGKAGCDRSIDRTRFSALPIRGQ